MSYDASTPTTEQLVRAVVLAVREGRPVDLSHVPLGTLRDLYSHAQAQSRNLEAVMTGSQPAVLKAQAFMKIVNVLGAEDITQLQRLDQQVEGLRKQLAELWHLRRQHPEQAQAIDQQGAPMQQYFNELTGALNNLGMALQQRLPQAIDALPPELQGLRSQFPTGLAEFLRRDYANGSQYQVQLENFGRLQTEYAWVNAARDTVGREGFALQAMLALAQEIIDKTQGILSKGAANQVQDMARLGGIQLELLMKVRGDEFRRGSISDPLLALGRDAFIASKLKVGNCGEHAAVAFCLLMKQLSGVRLTKIDHSIDHAFVVIGDIGNPDRAVVCDPWPRSATAVVLRDFFVSNLSGQSGITAIADGRDLIEAARGYVDVESLDNVMDMEKSPISPQQAQQQFGGHLYDHQRTTHD